MRNHVSVQWLKLGTFLIVSFCILDNLLGRAEISINQLLSNTFSVILGLILGYVYVASTERLLYQRLALSYSLIVVSMIIIDVSVIESSSYHGEVLNENTKFAFMGGAIRRLWKGIYL